MNENYLWDKSGRDPEIEKLENMLAVFRYLEIESPVLQMAKPVTIVKAAPRWRFSFAYAFAAVTMAVILAGVWIRSSPSSEESVASVVPAQINNEMQDALGVTATYDVPADGIRRADRGPNPVRTKGKRIAVFTERRKKVVDVVTHGRRGTVAFTKEEKYAYRQLMLALSITGSKLKIVKDTIDGIEGGENAVKENKR